jgi:hypothetical protein
MLLSASITDLIQIVENIAPPGLALPDDRIGLQVGDRRAVLTGVVVALDPCAAVVDRALSIEANAVVTHHPDAVGSRCPGRSSREIGAESTTIGACLVRCSYESGSSAARS